MINQLPRRPIFVLLVLSLLAIGLLSLQPTFDQHFFVPLVEAATAGPFPVG